MATYIYGRKYFTNTCHKEFQAGCQVVPNEEWIIVPGATSGRDDPNGHGTAVASKICGGMGGVAKMTTIIPVKINIKNILSWTSMWTRTLNDILQRQGSGNGAAPGKTVINFSNAYAARIDPFQVERVIPILRNIMDLGVSIVVAAGNEREKEGPNVSRAPAVWAVPELPIVVVSSVDRNFQTSIFSNAGRQTSVWAIGEEIVVALPTSHDAYQTDGVGTSCGK